MGDHTNVDQWSIAMKFKQNKRKISPIQPYWSAFGVSSSKTRALSSEVRTLSSRHPIINESRMDLGNSHSTESPALLEKAAWIHLRRNESSPLWIQGYSLSGAWPGLIGWQSFLVTPDSNLLQPRLPNHSPSAQHFEPIPLSKTK